jgi:hypothetical protein
MSRDNGTEAADSVVTATPACALTHEPADGRAAARRHDALTSIDASDRIEPREQQPLQSLRARREVGKHDVRDLEIRSKWAQAGDRVLQLVYRVHDRPSRLRPARPR